MNRKTKLTITTLTVIASYLTASYGIKKYKQNQIKTPISGVKNWEVIKASRNYVPLGKISMNDEDYGYVKWKKAN